MWSRLIRTCWRTTKWLFMFYTLLELLENEKMKNDMLNNAESSREVIPFKFIMENTWKLVLCGWKNVILRFHACGRRIILSPAKRDVSVRSAAAAVLLAWSGSLVNHKQHKYIHLHKIIIMLQFFHLFFCYIVLLRIPVINSFLW